MCSSDLLAQASSLMNEMFAALDIVDVATNSEAVQTRVAQFYFGLQETLELTWLRDQIIALPRDNRWQALSRASLRDGLYEDQARLTHTVLDAVDTDEDVNTAIERWRVAHWDDIARFEQMLAEVMSGPTPDLAVLSVCTGEFRSLCQLR